MKYTISILTLFTSVLTASPLFAAVEMDFIDNFTTSDSFNTGSGPANPFGNPQPKNSFDLSENPYLYLETPQNNFADPFALNATTLSKWYFGGAEKYSVGGPGDLNQNEFFFTPNNWDSIKQVGLWTIDSSYELHPLLNPGELTAFGGSVATFSVTSPTVTPEPISMALFGLGAGVLALTRRRKK